MNFAVSVAETYTAPNQQKQQSASNLTAEYYAMKTLLLLPLIFLLIGCSAQLTFIDRETGEMFLGQTGSTMSSSGQLTAVIEDESYQGDWIYTPDGGGYSLGSGTATATGTGGTATAYGTSNVITASASGNGLITLRGENGSYVRCVFNFNSFSDTGIGECQRNDGKLFDVTIKR